MERNEVTSLEASLAQARTLIASADIQALVQPEQALNVGWPTLPATAPHAEHFQAHVERARACCALAHENTAAHRALAKRVGTLPAPRVEPAGPRESARSRAELQPFALAAAQTREAIRADPLWRAATLALDNDAELAQGEPPLRARCLAIRDALEAPLRQLCAERDRAERYCAAQAAHGLSPELPHADTYVGPISREALHNELERVAAAANEKLGSDSPERIHARTAPTFRAVTSADAHVEFQPLLSRVINGREVQILRPLSGPPALVLAHTADLRPSPGSSRTVRFPPAVALAPTPRRTRARGVEW